MYAVLNTAVLVIIMIGEDSIRREANTKNEGIIKYLENWVRKRYVYTKIRNENMYKT
jgi:hypothetical protein